MEIKKSTAGGRRGFDIFKKAVLRKSGLPTPKHAYLLVNWFNW